MQTLKNRFNNKNNVLECRVCEDVFTIDGKRVPRLLYCGHTVCHACLLRLPLQNDTILCPFDRQPTPVETSGVWGLKKNFALLELLEKLELTDKESPEVDSEVVKNESEGWVGCDEDEGHTAVVYCLVCRSHLCAPCSLATHSTKTLAPHKRVPLSEKPRELPKCLSHPCHTAEFVCLKEDCRTPAVCYLCKEYGRHKDHPHSLIEAEAEKLRTLLSSAVQRTHQLIEQMNQTEHRLEEVVIGIEGNGSESGTLEAARSRVEHHFEELRSKLETQEATARSVIDTHARERLATLRASQQDIATWLAQVMSVVVLCESSLAHDDARLVSCGPQLKKAIDSIEKQHDQFNQLSPEQFNPDIPITFTKDNRVHIGPKIEMRVVALGLDGAGKSSILFKLKQNEFMSYRSPTIGFNVEPIEYKNLRFNIWDIGGQPKLRPLWKHYFLNTQAVVFVVDSNDKERLPEASLELAKLVSEKDLKEAALLILANKQDLNTCEGLEAITEALGASKLCCGHSWHLQACSAQTGAGLYQGLDWLSSQLVASPVTNYINSDSSI
ncbi:E3 ubiquitin-protein ligase TRIM23-like [Cimex lectularius]|uniref:RING-type E3 ubiquitin transferase n=1 Tax=Cimex lectularius TaxID=79782 RepID=A0A8I6S5Z7_CIMLE|nr:E3 ubiquitin-protein ligase TRIM23-like [Cimex lectularius]